jgi:phosphoribosylformylglycinamidine cyclo-ligase
MVVTYKDSGVDIDKGNQFVQYIKELVKQTHDDSVLGGIGGFSGSVKTSHGRIDLATDGVGTKLLIAQEAGIHHTIGIDLVAMSVNDLIVNGSRPIAFLDYIATGKLDLSVSYDIVRGIVEGCLQAGCPLVGGETAELPGMYPDGMYDLAGFAVGEPAFKVHKGGLREGNILIGVASSGLHSNGYSLARKVLMPNDTIKDLENIDVSLNIDLLDELLRPTTIYVGALQAAFNAVDVLGVAHITGGGLEENVPRMLGPGLAALVSPNSWTIHDIFKIIMKEGNVSLDDIRRTFNCGIGLVIAVHKVDVDNLMTCLAESGYNSFEIGSVTKAEGDKTFTYIP